MWTLSPDSVPLVARVMNAAAEGTSSGAGGDIQSTIMLFAALGFLLWLIVLRPQKKERAERQKLIDSVAKGDRIVSIGGIHGKVSDVDQTHNLVSVEIAPKVTMKFSRSAIQTVEKKDSGKAANTDKSKESKT
jgi:preprotein translocase subunit YajC